MDLAAIQAAVEQACVEFQHPETQARAEQVLLHFRQAHRPALPAARHILQHSHSADARFQAALALKDALVREWATLSDQQRDELQGWLLSELVRLAEAANGGAADPAHGSKAAHAVRASLAATLAVAIKRSWMEKPPETRAALLQNVLALVSGCGDGACSATAGCALLGLLTAVVSEFHLATASPLGLPWDVHMKACRDMESHHLRHMFGVAAGLARRAVESGSAARGEDQGVAAAAAALMTACLQWDFKRSGMPGQAALSLPHAKRGADLSGPVAPGESWAALLLDPAVTGWLVVLLQQLRAAYGPLAASAPSGRNAPPALAALPPDRRAVVTATAVKARGLLLALCSLSGDVFPKHAGHLRHSYLHSLMQGVLPLAWPLSTAMPAAAAVGFESSELLDACRCIAALAPIHRAAPLQAAATAVLGGVPPDTQPPAPHLLSPPPLPGAEAGGFLGVLQLLTQELIRVAGVNASGFSTIDEGDDTYWQHEALDMLLEAWVALLASDSVALARNDLPPGATAAAAAVFRAVVEAALADAAKGAADEVHDSHEAAEAASQDDWMARLASMARHAPPATFPLLAHAAGSAQHTLAAAAAAGACRDPSAPLEQLCWLSRLSAHCLADSGAGETPLVPLALLQGLETGAPGVADAMQQLCASLLGLPALVLQPAARPVMSPRLMEACVWSLSRWCDTYLFPEDPLPPPLDAVYGAQPPSQGGDGDRPPSGPEGAPGPGAANGDAHMAGGAAVLDMAVQVAIACLTSYHGEAELHKQVVHALLPVLTRRKPLCERLVRCSTWGALADAFATRAPLLQQGLGQKLHRGLAQSLCLAAHSIPRTSAASHYVTQLLGKTAMELTALSERPDLASVAARADVVTGVCCMLEAWRGATCAALSRTQPTLFAMTRGLLQPLLALQGAFKAHSQATALILKLAGDIVEAHVSFLKPDEVEAVLRWVLALLHQYSSLTGGAWAGRLAAASQAQHDAALVEAARDMRALLRLLSHVTQRDLVEGSGAGAGGGHTTANATAANGTHAQPSLDAAQVVLAGLTILLPLMTAELLKFPKLPRLYFSLLAYVMEGFPEQIAALPPDLFAQLMSSLEYGLGEGCTDAVVLQSSLEGLAGLARYQLRCHSGGQPGLAAHGTVGGGSVTSHFLELLLRRLLLGGWGQDLVELAADSVQPLLALETGVYLGLVQQLVQSQMHDATSGQRIGAALASLVNPEQVAAMGQAGLHMTTGPGGQPLPPVALGRVHKRVFRQALCHVVSDVRAVVCVR